MTNRTPEIKAGLYFFSVACLIAMSFALTAAAQETPRIAVSAGYSYLRFDSTTLGFEEKTDLHGGNAGVAYNLTPYFGVAAEAGGHYGSHLRFAEWLIGPRLYYHKWGADLFGHFMFGRGQARIDVTDPFKSTGRAFAVGGGIDYPISSHFSFRVVQADYLSSHTLDQDQRSLRLTTGLVFRWGVVAKHKPQLAAP